MHITLAGCRGFLPVRLAPDRFQPVQEARRHSRSAASLGAMAQDHILIAEQLRKIMRGEADSPLRQIEAEFMPHWPAQPWIDSWRRRPRALDQAANNHAISLHQP